MGLSHYVHTKKIVKQMYCINYLVLAGVPTCDVCIYTSIIRSDLEYGCKLPGSGGVTRSCTPAQPWLWPALIQRLEALKQLRLLWRTHCLLQCKAVVLPVYRQTLLQPFLIECPVWHPGLTNQEAQLMLTTGSTRY